MARMVTHAQIIDNARHGDVKGTQAVHAALRGVESIHTVRSWRQRDSIPAHRWKDVSDAGFATLEELAAAAASRTEGAAA